MTFIHTELIEGEQLFWTTSLFERFPQWLGDTRRDQLFREISWSIEKIGAGYVAEHARKRHGLAVTEAALNLAGINQHLGTEARQKRLNHGSFHFKTLAFSDQRYCIPQTKAR
jgi:hypothetical protein